MAAAARIAATRSYRLCGLTLASCQELPGAAEGGAGGPEVVLSYGAIPDHLEAVTRRGPNWEIGEQVLLLRIPGMARFLIRDGREIRVEPATGCRPAELAGFLTGTVFGALLHQRGCFVLHASAVEVEGAAVLFCGASGSGKSVLAAALCAAGHGWIADEICRIETRGGALVVLPDGHRLKLWSDSIAGLRLDRGPCEPVRPGVEKFWLDPPRPAVPHAVPVRAIYFLRALRPSMQAGIHEVELLDALALLRTHAYRPRLIQAFGREQAWLEASVRIARRAAAWDLTREISFDALAACVQMLERHWSH